LKVLQCIDTLAVGGAERVVVDICNLLYHDRQYDVTLLIIRHKGPLISSINSNIRVIELNLDSKFSLKGWYSLIKSLYGFDLIHVHMRHTYGRLKLGTLFGRIKTPVIFHDHFGDIEHNKQVPKYLKGIFAPRYYIGVSRDLSNWAINNIIRSSDNVWTLPNTIARNFDFANQKYTSGQMVMVSNLRDTKNIEFAIKIAKLMNLKLDIYGQINDKSYFHKLKESAFGFPIKFITDVSDVFPFLSNYQLAIHTAKSETGPLVIMEYLKAGISFIAFDTGEVIHQIKDLYPQLIMTNFNEYEWIDRINYLLKNPVEKDVLIDSFESKFGEKAYINRLKEIYQCLGTNC
jgi:glycosyltransferase involved in cell wall biosynthesis